MFDDITAIFMLAQLAGLAWVTAQGAYLNV